MKIISNFKDYYDFLQGEFGVDPKAVYERICKDGSGHKAGVYVPEFMKPRPSIFHSKWEEEQYDKRRQRPTLFRLAICGRIYCVSEQNGVLLHGPETWPKHINKGRDYLDFLLNKDKELDALLSVYPDELRASMHLCHLNATTLNEMHLCPVILLDDKNNVNVLNPRLSDFQFAKAMPPKEMFLLITDFLLKERPMQEKKSDPKEKNKQRILAHGFDLKTSFRKDKET